MEARISVRGQIITYNFGETGQLSPIEDVKYEFARKGHKDGLEQERDYLGVEFVDMALGLFGEIPCIERLTLDTQDHKHMLQMSYKARWVNGPRELEQTEKLLQGIEIIIQKYFPIERLTVVEPHYLAVHILREFQNRPA
jgi:hypothetical protein